MNKVPRPIPPHPTPSYPILFIIDSPYSSTRRAIAKRDGGRTSKGNTATVTKTASRMWKTSFETFAEPPLVISSTSETAGRHFALPTTELVTMTPEAGVRLVTRHPCVAFVALCACLLWRSPSACGFRFAAPRISGRGHERRAALPPRVALGRTHQARRRRLSSAGAISREEGVRRREWPLLAEHGDGDGLQVCTAIDAREEEGEVEHAQSRYRAHGDSSSPNPAYVAAQQRAYEVSSNLAHWHALERLEKRR